MKKIKNIKSFWGIVLVFTAGVVAGGIIYAVAYNGILEDDINSIGFSAHKEDRLEIKTSPNSAKAPVYLETEK